MKRNISSISYIQFFRFILPSIGVIIFSSATIISFISQGDLNDAKWFFLFLLMIWVVGFYYYSMKMKNVSLENGFIYVGEPYLFYPENYTETKVPIYEIKKITRIMGLPEYIWIHFKDTTKYGKKIVFIPKQRYYRMWFSSTPIYKELKEILNQVDGNSD